MNYVVRGALRVERPRRLRNGRQPADGIESEAFRRPLLDGHVLGGLHFLLCNFECSQPRILSVDIQSKKHGTAPTLC